jgi:hypothetical protein
VYDPRIRLRLDEKGNMEPMTAKPFLLAPLWLWRLMSGYGPNLADKGQWKPSQGHEGYINFSFAPTQGWVFTKHRRHR